MYMGFIFGETYASCAALGPGTHQVAKLRHTQPHKVAHISVLRVTLPGSESPLAGNSLSLADLDQQYDFYNLPRLLLEELPASVWKFPRGRAQAQSSSAHLAPPGVPQPSH